MKIGYLTDKGQRRPINEDAVKILPEKNFFMLADGVGGNRAGEVASKQALVALEDYLNNNPLHTVNGSEQISRYFENAVSFVNEYIRRLSEEIPEYAGMATTLVFAYFKDQILYVGNVGDSRVYFVHNNTIHQVTVDHTYVNDLVMMGAITREEAEHHAKKNVITRAIGSNAYSCPDTFNIFIEEGDKILICSDGLYDEVTERDMLIQMLGTHDMSTCAQTLVDMANANGGNDNISVICIDLMEA